MSRKSPPSFLSESSYLPRAALNISGLRPNVSLHGPTKKESIAGIRTSIMDRAMEKADANRCRFSVFSVVVFRQSEADIFSIDVQNWVSIEFGTAVSVEVHTIVSRGIERAYQISHNYQINWTLRIIGAEPAQLFAFSEARFLLKLSWSKRRWLHFLLPILRSRPVQLYPRCFHSEE